MMPSMSQIDMVVVDDGTMEVCGNLKAGPGNAPGRAEFLIVVRQGDKVATLRETRPDDGHPDTFGRWEFEHELGPRHGFARGPAVVSAVVVLEHEPGGLATLNWVQPVTIGRRRTPPVPFDPHPVALSEPDGELTTAHSVSSSLTIEESASGAGTHHWSHQLETLPVPHHPTGPG
jgi:hypothetical protein